MTYWKWSHTAASNANSDSTINWAEGQSPGSVNNSARAMMSASSKHRDDISNAGPTAGTASAYTLSTSQGLTALTDKFQVSFVAHAANGAGATISIDGLGAKPLATVSGAAIGAGVLTQGGLFTISYDSAEDEWLVHGIQADPSSFPVGFLGDFMGSTTPSGWLLANGQAVSRTTYADLFAELGTVHGTGDGSTTFNVPDCRGRVVAGSDTMGTTAAGRLSSASMSADGQTIGDTGGTETHVLATGELPSHTHSGTSLSATSAGAHGHGVTDPGHTHAINDYRTLTNYDVTNATIAAVSGTGLSPFSSSAAATSISIQSAGAHTHPISGNTGTAGSGDAHLNTQPTIVANKIIKF